MSGRPQAFLSYTRLDDQVHSGGITKLRAALELQVRAVTGDHGFWIFQDVDGIGLGENWPRLLDENLAVAPFLIPVLTPSFFRSSPCRDELRKFLAHEHARGRDDLVLPIYLVEAPVLEQPELRDKDDLAKTIARRQRWPWQLLALKPVGDPAVKREVRKLAVAIRKRLEPEAHPLAIPNQPRPPAWPASEPQPPSPRAPRTWQPAHVFRDVDAPWCPEVVVIPAGSFMMGSPPDEEGRSNDEGPQRRVAFARPFAIGRYTVTFAEWDACVAAGGCNGYRPADQGWGRGRQPVINVSWEDAQAFVAWLAEKTGQPYRLPTEAEWEHAARAGTTTPFWTGATISTAQANYDGNYTYGAGKKGTYREKTVAVDDLAFPANPIGLYHVHGNVWEWVQDCYRDSYDNAPLDGSIAVETSDSLERVLRGGSWGSVPRSLRSAYRSRRAPDNRNDNFGFRVARMLTS